MDRPAWTDRVRVVSGHSDLRPADCYMTEVIGRGAEKVKGPRFGPLERATRRAHKSIGRPGVPVQMSSKVCPLVWQPVLSGMVYDAGLCEPPLNP